MDTKNEIWRNRITNGSIVASSHSQGGETRHHFAGRGGVVDKSSLTCSGKGLFHGTSLTPVSVRKSWRAEGGGRGDLWRTVRINTEALSDYERKRTVKRKVVSVWLFLTEIFSAMFRKKEKLTRKTTVWRKALTYLLAWVCTSLTRDVRSLFSVVICDIAV